MILNRNFQTIVNILVLMLFLGFVILGALFALPARSPFGPLMGKLMSSKSLLSGIIASLDPAELAKALNDNPEFTKELIAQLQRGRHGGSCQRQRGIHHRIGGLPRPPGNRQYRQ